MNKYIIVDDEQLIRRGLAALISRVAPNWTLAGEAWNGEEALALAERLQPDLIISDIRMPEMNGLTMAQRLIEQGMSMPVVFFTGHDEFVYIQQAIRANAFDYLLKPVRETDARLLFERYEREYGVKKTVPQHGTSLIKQYEFDLMNALERRSVDSLRQLEAWYEKLNGVMTLRAFVDLTTRTVNAYLLRFDIIGAEYKPVINETNEANVIQRLEEYCIAQLQETRTNAINPIIEQTKSWLEEQLHVNPTLSEAAARVQLNPTYFSEYFKKHMGETFLQYVTRMKIQRAKQLLADHTLRVYDIASLVGYTDHRHFSKVFQAKTGMTPTEYRSQVLRMSGSPGDDGTAEASL